MNLKFVQPLRGIYSILIAILLLSTYKVNAQQNKSNYGLSQPQEVNTLPKSLASIVMPQRKPKIKPKTVLEVLPDRSYNIKAGWELISEKKINASGGYISTTKLDTKDWYNATVPGTVLTTLVDQGIYPDPYYGLNNLQIPDDLCRQNWWYRTEFESNEKNLLNNKKAWLIFKGINYQADIWLNGHLLGKISGAFKRGRFDATDYLNPKGYNVLAVLIIPPQNPGIPHEESPSAGRGPNGGLLTTDGPTFFASEGWDWIPGIRDRNIGIWQSVQIQYTGDVNIVDPQVITDLPLPDTSKAHLTVQTEIKNNSGKPQTVSVKGQIEGINFTKEYHFRANEVKQIKFTPQEFKQLTLIKPRLWWPNGYGQQEMYTLKLVVSVNGQVSEEKTVRFGIRELSYDLTVDMPNQKAKRIEFNPTSDLKAGKPLFDNDNRREVEPKVTIPSLLPGIDPSIFTSSNETSTAPFLVLRVNGKKIFCKGGNWGMDDGMKRVSRERLTPYFKLHKDANFNMIRNWTGESTEEVFYELCDEYGMLVWNDFWISTQGYNLEVSDEDMFMANATDVVKRFRNHPSIAIWCPRNEGYALPEMDLKLATLIAIEDGTRLYQGNSRNLNLRDSGPWDYEKDPTTYFTKIAKGFSTELGTPSVPTAASMRKMMAKEDVWPISDAWYYHDLHFGQKEYLRAVDSLYGKPANLEDFDRKVQMINYDSHRAMFESWNSKIWNNTTGLLLWMTHPAWPSTVWQVYSWDYETFGSYFASLKACEPIHIQMNLDDNEVIVVNTSLRNLKNASITLSVFNLKGQSVYTNSMVIDVLENQLNKGFKASLPAVLPENYLVRLVLKDNKGNIISQNDYWKNNGKNANFLAFNDLQEVKPKLQIQKVISINDMVQTNFSITNESNVPALGLKLNLKDALGKEIVLPAYFSDGYFTLLPGESRKLSLQYPSKFKEVEIAMDGYNIGVTENTKVATKE